MRKILTIIACLITFNGWAQGTDDFPTYTDERLHDRATNLDMRAVHDITLFAGHFADSATLAGAFAAASYDGYWAFTDDAPWRLFLSDGTNWNPIAGSGGGGGSGDLWSDVVDADIRMSSDGAHSIGSATADVDTIFAETIEVEGLINGTDIIGSTEIEDDAVAEVDLADIPINIITETGTAVAFDETDITHPLRRLIVHLAPTGTATWTLDQGIAGESIEFVLTHASNTGSFAAGGGVTIHGELELTFQYQTAIAYWIDANNVLLITQKRDVVTYSYVLTDTSLAVTTTDIYLGHLPHDFTVTNVWASCDTAPTGADIEIDVKEEGTTILSTVISIDATQDHSSDSATPPVISDSSIAQFSKITADIDQVGSTVAGKNIWLYIEGYK